MVERDGFGGAGVEIGNPTRLAVNSCLCPGFQVFLPDVMRL